MATRSPATPSDALLGSVKKLAISYARVSTGTQATADASGIERQESAIQQWLQQHTEYELDREIRYVGSGAKAGRFEWFIEELQRGRLPQGTCLVVEKMSRLGREELDDTFETLIRIFKAGGALAVCSLAGGQVLRSLSSQQGAVYQLVGAIDAARIEWEDKRDRKLGSDAKRRRLIAEGGKPFRSRQKGANRAMYPFWLDFDERTQKFKLNDQAKWVEQVFRLAQEVGSPTIARRLKAQGVRCPTDRRKAIAASYVVKLLGDRAVLGELQHRNRKGDPVGDPVPGVFPPVITPDEWELARRAVEKRHAGQCSTGSKRHNLFEKRIFCSQCCGRLGLYQCTLELASGELRDYRYLRCLNRHKDSDACSAPRRSYDEERLLDRLQSFRWADYFSDAKHEAELSECRQQLLGAQARQADAERELKNTQASVLATAKEGETISGWLEDEARKLQLEYADAQAAVNVARAALETLQRRRTGRDAQKAIQGRVAAFMASDRTDVENRQQFNRWLFAEDLVIAYDLQRDTFELGTGKVSPQGQLMELDQRVDDAAAFGMDVDQVRRDLAAREQAIAAQLTPPASKPRAAGSNP